MIVLTRMHKSSEIKTYARTNEGPYVQLLQQDICEISLSSLMDRNGSKMKLEPAFQNQDRGGV